MCNIEEREACPQKRVAAFHQRSRVPHFTQTTNCQWQFWQWCPIVPLLQVRPRGEVLDDTADELLVDLAADQAQHLAPVVVAAVVVEQLDQTILIQRLGDVELVDDLGRTEILQERAWRNSGSA